MVLIRSYFFIGVKNLTPKFLMKGITMDRISYDCANEINDDLAWFYQYVCKRNLKVYRDPVSGSGGHYCDEYIDDLRWDDEPEDMWDDTVIAPNWDELRQMLNALEPSYFILSEFEAIENIDEYAVKLKDYYIEKKSYDKSN